MMTNKSNEADCQVKNNNNLSTQANIKKPISTDCNNNVNDESEILPK